VDFADDFPKCTPIRPDGGSTTLWWIMPSSLAEGRKDCRDGKPKGQCRGDSPTKDRHTQRDGPGLRTLPPGENSSAEVRGMGWVYICRSNRRSARRKKSLQRSRQGAKFTLHSAAERKMRSCRPYGSGFSGKTVLVVDDESRMVEFISMNWSWRASGSSGGQRLRSSGKGFQGTPTWYCWTSLMPEMDGFETLRDCVRQHQSRSSS